MSLHSIGSLLHHCARTKSYCHGTSLHAASVKVGLLFDTIISNHVLNMYAKCGRIYDACQLFDEMLQRNLVSWSALISGCNHSSHHLLALQLFTKIPFVPNEYIYASSISSCASLRYMQYGQQVHCHSVKSGYASVVFVSNSLISMYMKLGMFGDAVAVHACMTGPNLVTYNALISGFVENQLPDKAFEAFKMLLHKGIVPDKFTFVMLSGVCPESDNFVIASLLHCMAIKLNLDSSHFVGNLLMTMYSKFSLISSVDIAFGCIKDRDVISWNTLIAAYSQCNDHLKGLGVFREMNSTINIHPDGFTFASVLVACAGLASIHQGKQVHAHLLRNNLLSDVGVYNALVSMYSKCGCLNYASNSFSTMHSPNLVSWNTIIAGFGNHGLGERAFEIFELMLESGFRPDVVTFSGLLVACNHAGLVDKGLSYFHSMKEEYGISPGIEHFSCLIDMLGRAGRLKEAEDYITKYDFGNDPIILGSLLSACRLHGDISIGELLAQKLIELKPVTTSPYVLLSSLYALDEAWDSVLEVRRLLKISGLKKEPGYSIIEVEGTLKKFTNVIKRDLDFSSHGDISIGELLAQKLIELKPITTSPYVLLSSLYALDEAWDSVLEVRRLLKISGLKMEPGYSIIEVEGTLKKFTNEDLLDTSGDLESRTHLDLSCTKVTVLPNYDGQLGRPEYLYWTRVEELQDATGELKSLRDLNLSLTLKLNMLPNSIEIHPSTSQHVFEVRAHIATEMRFPDFSNLKSL
ncbi:hypothetical protein SAY86_001766 [Trapa natans]|uniref:Pentatricopeptide repeat-containing protein n=1 Tax=Trapa natans TaxID=22666 RepID=A0AAN7LSR7_TRANT|nr:hypothetical protein SAY86_001766 [Trapa natans]